MSNRLTILLYHSVRNTPDAFARGIIDVGTFRAQIQWLKRYFELLPLGQAVSRWRNGTLRSRTACITFDDGYKDNLDVACPVLQDAGVRATFFVATGYLAGGCMWNDAIVESIRGFDKPSLDLEELGQYPCGTTEQKRDTIRALIMRLKYLPSADRAGGVDRLIEYTHASIPDHMMMSESEVRKLRDCGMEIGAHTVSHPILTSIPNCAAQMEIRDSKRDLEQVLDETVTLFAYPNGAPDQDYAAQHVEMVRSAGFDVAVTTSRGQARLNEDLCQLARFSPGPHTGAGLIGRLVKDGWFMAPGAV